MFNDALVDPRQDIGIPPQPEFFQVVQTLGTVRDRLIGVKFPLRRNERDVGIVLALLIIYLLQIALELF